MTPEPRYVLDTNVLVSALLLPNSLPRRAMDKVLDTGVLLFSRATLRETVRVLQREKFTQYATPLERESFLRFLVNTGELVKITEAVSVCRDPKDDKFLELAAAGGAACIVSGDNDLLALHPFQDIPILTPAAFMEK